MTDTNHRPVVGIVYSRWMNEYASSLVERFRNEMDRIGFDAEEVRVPGAFTLAYGVRRLAAAHPRCFAFVAFAVMIRGETSHADDLVRASLSSLADAMRDLDRPIVCELLVADSAAQLAVRCGQSEANRGFHAAQDIKLLFDLG